MHHQALTALHDNGSAAGPSLGVGEREREREREREGVSVCE